MPKEAKEVLVVASKVKGVVRKQDKKCSSDVMGPLSDLIQNVLSNAVELAESDGMKTVQGKHVEQAVKQLSNSKTEEE